MNGHDEGTAHGSSRSPVTSTEEEEDREGRSPVPALRAGSGGTAPAQSSILLPGLGESLGKPLVRKLTVVVKQKRDLQRFSTHPVPTQAMFWQ